jgi:hypothetical protein
MSQFQSNLVQITLGKGNLKLCKSRARSSSKREIITKIQWGHLKVLSRTTKPGKTQIYTKAS